MGTGTKMPHLICQERSAEIRTSFIVSFNNFISARMLLTFAKAPALIKRLIRLRIATTISRKLFKGLPAFAGGGGRMGATAVGTAGLGGGGVCVAAGAGVAAFPAGAGDVPGAGGGAHFPPGMGR